MCTCLCVGVYSWWVYSVYMFVCRSLFMVGVLCLHVCVRELLHGGL